MQSENIDQLATALSKAQGMIKSAAKSKENPFFRSHYADLPAVWDACRDALCKNGLAVIQAPQYEGEQTWLETTLVHSSGQWMRSKYPIKPVKNDPQGVGSAVTYSRRYALMAMVGVVADEDDDGNAASGKVSSNGHAPAPTPPAPAPAAQRPSKASDAKADALKWIQKHEKILEEFTTAKAVDQWANAYDADLVRLKALDTDLYDRMMDAVINKRATFSPLNA